MKTRRDEQHLLGFSVDERRRNDARDHAGITETGSISETNKALLDLHAAETIESGGLLSHGEESNAGALAAQFTNQTFARAHD